MMTLGFPEQAPPLRMNDDGVILIGKTRVPLATLVFAFRQGATAEEFVQQYSAVTLAEAYLTMGYYLLHQAEVDAYLHQQRTEAAAVRQENEARFNPIGIRERLLARRQS